MAISVGDMLSGLGAAIGGTGQQYVQGLKTREADARKQKMEEMQFRQKAMYEDAYAALQLQEQEDYTGIEQLGRDRLDMLRMFPDADPTDTAEIIQLSMYAQRGDVPAKAQLRARLLDATRRGLATGFLEPSPAPEEYTMSPGQVRFSGGRPIASVPAAETVQYRMLTQGQASSMGLDPAKQYQQNTVTGQISAVGGGGINIDMTPDMEVGLRQKALEGYIGQIPDVMQSASQQIQLADEIQTMADLANKEDTSLFKKFMTTNYPDISVAVLDKTGALSTFQAIQNRLAPRMRPVGSGSTSDMEVRMYMNSLPSFMQNKEGRQLTSEIFQAKADIEREKQRAINDYYAGKTNANKFVLKMQEVDSKPLFSEARKNKINAIMPGFFQTQQMNYIPTNPAITPRDR